VKPHSRLSREGFERASAFIFLHGRPLEGALFAYEFENGSSDDVVRELERYRNPDGGFGHALEPDFLLPDSSALATTAALQVLHQVEAKADHPLVRGALTWLVEAYEPERDVWLSVPSRVDEFPRAPWWDFAANAPDAPHLRLNPRAEIAAWLWQWPDAAPAKLRERVTPGIVANLEQWDTDPGADALLCVQRLAEVRALPGSFRERVRRKLLELGPQVVTRDPAAWTDYCAKPIKLAPRPSSPLAAVLGEEMPGSLTYEVEHQAEEGCWTPYWTWQGRYPDQWAVAEREWKGILTLQMLEALRAWDRLAD
jgi:hypothetical protein